MNGKVRTIIGLSAGAALISVLAWGVLLLPVTTALADTSGSVQVSLSAVNEVAPGTDFAATVEIGQVEDFDACNYDVSFDPTVLRLDNVTSGDIGGTVIPVDIWNEISSGKYTIVQNIPGLSGITGSGHLAVLHFHVIGSQGQDSNIGLSNGVLGDILGDVAIPATWTGALVHVNTAEAGGQESTPASTPQPEAETEEVSEATSTPEPQAPPETASLPEAETEDVSTAASTPESPTPPETASLPEAEPETTEVSSLAPTDEPPAPPPPPAQPETINWPVIWGAIGGTIIFTLIVFTMVRRRSY